MYTKMFTAALFIKQINDTLQQNAAEINYLNKSENNSTTN